MEKQQDKLKAVHVNIPESLHRHIKLKAALEGRMMKDIIANALIEKFGSEEIDC